MAGWIRFENTTPETLDRKTMERDCPPISDRAFRLWFNACCYCSRGETDGRIPATVAATLTAGARKAILELVAAGLFDVADRNTYIVHDYLHYNPSRAKLNTMRSASRERVSQWRSSRESDAGNDACNAVTENVTNAVTEPVPLACATDSDVLTAVVAVPETSQGSEDRAIFDFWREQCGHPDAKPSWDRMAKIRARRNEGYTVEQIREAIVGASRAAHVSDAGRRFDDIELICRNGSKLESFIARASAAPPSSARPNASQLLRKLAASEAAS